MVKYIQIIYNKKKNSIKNIKFFFAKHILIVSIIYPRLSIKLFRLKDQEVEILQRKELGQIKS
jgi:hypothetical protein